MATVKSDTTAKRTIKRPAPKAAQPQAEAPKAAPKPAKPVIAKHQFQSAHTGASDVVNARPSRQAIDYSKFGTLTQAPLTARDEAAIASFRKEFGPKAFERGNLDTGILRRLGERGVIVHVDGSAVDPKATFKLTAKGLGKAA
jgi:hypothetical protein